MLMMLMMLLAFLGGFTLALDIPKFYIEEGVLSLEKETFAQTVKKDQMWFIEFFAPWCPHCQHYAPEFAKINAALKGPNASLGIHAGAGAILYNTL
jgi:thiol-disulfide isomerase/thioredoxin